MNINKLIIASLLFGSAATLASASTITELEVNGTASNNTLATAQAIGASSFTPNANPNVFGTLPTVTIQGRGGNGDVDFFSFVTKAGKAYFDIDNTQSGFDSVLSLFNSSGTLLAFDDDSLPPDPGSTSNFDAFLGSINLAAGTYFIAVSDSGNLPNSLATATGFTDLFRPDNALGGSAVTGATPGDSTFFGSGTQGGLTYLLNISAAGAGVSTKVPVPGTLLLLSVGAGALLLGRKRKSGNYA
jgi:hypothetical protein